MNTDPNRDNILSELSDLDLDNFESDEEEVVVEEEEEEEDSVIKAHHSYNIAGLEALQNFVANSVEEVRDVPTTHIWSPPVEFADPVTIDMLSNGRALLTGQKSFCAKHY